MKDTNNIFINTPFTLDFLQEPVPSESHAYLEILFAMKGKCNIEINKQPYFFTAGDIVVISPYELAEIYKGDFTMLSLKIDIPSYPFLSEVLETSDILCNSSLSNNKGKYTKLKAQLANLLKYNLSDKIYATSNYAIISAVLAELIESFSTPKNNQSANESKNKERIIEITNYIHKNYNKGITLSELAFAFHLSIPYLSNFFIKNFNMNFTRYYAEVRLNYALKDLLCTNKTIEDIALENGFPSSHAFLRAFKTKYNELPSEYRRNAIIEKKKHQNSYNNNLSNEDLEILSEFINNENSIIKPPTIVQSVDLGTISATSPIENTVNPTTKILGLGTAKLLVYNSIQEAVRKCQSECHFEYGHIRGMFNDELYFASKINDDEIYYNFTLINNILDFIIKNDLKPMIELNYMPEALAKNKDKTVFSNHYIVSSPAKISEWTRMIDLFINHCISRYGMENVKEWVFIPWSQPDSTTDQFAFDSLENFYLFYKATYDTIKKINPSFHVASPEVLPTCDERIEWLDKFLSFTKANDCIPNSIAMSVYHDTQFGSELFKDFTFQNIPPSFIISDDPDKMKHTIYAVNEVLAAQKLDHLCKYITSYNFTLSHINPIYDTVFMSSYIVKNIIDNIETVNAFGYWKLSDFEENYGGQGPFPGGIGLYYNNGIKKPQMHAYLMLRRLSNNIISRGDGYIITKDDTYDEKYYIVFYNYEHPAHAFNQNQMFDMNYTNRYSPFKMIEKDIHFRLNHINGDEIQITQTAINQEHGSAFDHWIKMGAPEIVKDSSSNSLVYESLLYSSIPEFKQQNIKIIKGTLDMSVHLAPLEIRSLEIKVIKNKNKNKSI